jgi:hypothetical protein
LNVKAQNEEPNVQTSGEIVITVKIIWESLILEILQFFFFNWIELLG